MEVEGLKPRSEPAESTPCGQRADPTPSPDVRELAAKALFTDDWRGEADWLELRAGEREQYLGRADAVLAAVSPVIRRQVEGERTYPNVVVDGEEWEHYDRLGPGCWHRVKGMGPCLSWQGLMAQAEFHAGWRAATAARAEVAEEIARAIGEECRVKLIDIPGMHMSTPTSPTLTARHTRDIVAAQAAAIARTHAHPEEGK